MSAAEPPPPAWLPPPPSWPAGPPPEGREGAALAGRWERLHPASPIVRVGPAIIIAVVLLIGSRRTSGNQTGDWIRIAVLGFVVLAGFISWAVTRWRVSDGTLQIETGLLRRSSLRFPLTQIQAVDVVRPGLARIFGLAELRVRMASGGRSTGRLAYMGESQAEAVRTQLMTLARKALDGPAGPPGSVEGVSASAGAPAAPAAPPMPVFRVESGRLVASILIGGPALVVYVLIAGLVALAVASPAAAGGAVAGSSSTLIAFAGAMWTRVNGQYGMTLSVAPDGMHVSSGLVQTTAETIPWGRIQALRMVEPLLWRPLGWCRLEADLAGRNVSGRQDRAARRAGRAIIPVGRRAEAESIVRLVMPDLPPRGQRPPSRARLKSPLRYSKLSFAANQHYAMTTSGRLWRVTDTVPLAKVQSIRWVQGPLQRRLRLASIHLDTAGRSVFSIGRDRDRTEADRLMSHLPDVCRAARREEYDPFSKRRTPSELRPDAP